VVKTVHLSYLSQKVKTFLTKNSEKYINFTKIYATSKNLRIRYDIFWLLGNIRDAIAVEQLIINLGDTKRSRKKASKNSPKVTQMQKDEGLLFR
jgi:hypothetical protein